MSTRKAMNHGNNAVAADQANVSVPMPDEQMAPNGGLSVSFNFPIDSLTAAARLKFRPAVLQRWGGHESEEVGFQV